MRILLFLHRVTFICNLFFIVCLFMQYTNYINLNRDLQSIIIILGFFLSFILGFVVHLWELLIIYRKAPVSLIPKYLRVFNLAVFLFQIVYFLY
ncbi:hypothetical protein BH11BAC6_BH11BAC6_18050 [soil metagenome]